MRETNPAVPKWSANRYLCNNGTDYAQTLSTPLSNDELQKIKRAKEKVASQIFK